MGSINWPVFGLVFLGLVIFGLFVNWLVVFLQKHQAINGRMSFLVVVGVVGTLGGAAVIVGPVSALVVCALFVASGTPMIIGEWIRDTKDRKAAQELWAEVVKDAES